MTKQHPDSGFTLIEVLLVIVILGLLASVVVASVGGIKGQAEASVCDADRRVLYTAVETFFAQRNLDAIPAADASPDRYELTLVDEQVLRSPSELFDLDDRGELTVADGSPCSL
jgi:prepilin-type N-terminal cleavage/methylation domain-containing protein